MRAVGLMALSALAAASAAMAQAPGPRDTATVCLDPMGVGHPAHCESTNASRFATQPDICLCRGPLRQVDAPWCAAGEAPAADTADFDRARVAYASSHGNSLVGFSYQGKRACVPPNGAQ